jgi:hypothetical protein
MSFDRSRFIPTGEKFGQALETVQANSTAMSLPKHPDARRRYVEQFRDGAWDTLSAAQKLTKVGTAEMGGGIRAVLPKRYNPLQSPTNKDLPYFDDSFSKENWDAMKLCRAWCRFFYMTHHLVPTCIDIFSR